MYFDYSCFIKLNINTLNIVTKSSYTKNNKFYDYNRYQKNKFLKIQIGIVDTVWKI